MMPELANPVRQSVTVIEIRPFKGGPYVLGDNAKQSATNYAKARANVKALPHRRV